MGGQLRWWGTRFDLSPFRSAASSAEFATPAGLQRRAWRRPWLGTTFWHRPHNPVGCQLSAAPVHCREIKVLRPKLAPRSVCVCECVFWFGVLCAIICQVCRPKCGVSSGEWLLRVEYRQRASNNRRPGNPRQEESEEDPRKVGPPSLKKIDTQSVYQATLRGYRIHGVCLAHTKKSSSSALIRLEKPIDADVQWRAAAAAQTQKNHATAAEVTSSISRPGHPRECGAPRDSSRNRGTAIPRQ